MVLVDLVVYPLVILRKSHAALVVASAGRFGMARVILCSAVPHTFALVSEPVPRLQRTQNSLLPALSEKPGSLSWFPFFQY